MYLWLKAFHIIAMVCWFAGLFYLPRLFVYHAMSEDQTSRERFCVMERKLYRGIMMPSMLATLVLGLWMLYLTPGWLSQGWLHAKLTLVVLLIGYHHACGAMLKRFARGEPGRSHVFYRWFNEVPVLFLLLIVLLVVLKPSDPGVLSMSLPALLDQRLRLPMVAAPMFLVSNPQLVLACCRSGIVGSFPALNQRESSGFEGWLEEIGAGLQALDNPAPYAVNLIVHNTNPRLQADLRICVEHRVPIVITSLGAVREVVDAVHGYGGLVFHDVTTRRHAEKAAEAGVDGLIAVAAGAGGHAGTWSPFALVAEIRQFFDKTLLLAGCINHGHEILAAQMLGADLAYLGTRFIATRESNASDAYKQMILEARAADIVHTPAVSGVPASFMRQSLEAAGYDLKRLTDKADMDYGEKLKPVNDEAKAWKTVWSAGQGAGNIDDLPGADELVARLDREYRAALRNMDRLANRWPR